MFVYMYLLVLCIFFTQVTYFVKRAETQKLKDIFAKVSFILQLFYGKSTLWYAPQSAYRFFLRATFCERKRAFFSDRDYHLVSHLKGG